VKPNLFLDVRWVIAIENLCGLEENVSPNGQVDNGASTPAALCAAGAGGRNNGNHMRLRRLRRLRRQNTAKFPAIEGTSPRGEPCLRADEARYIYSAFLLICRLFFSCCDQRGALRTSRTAPAPYKHRATHGPTDGPSTVRHRKALYGTVKCRTAP
jgi:hypothetical protein